MDLINNDDRSVGKKILESAGAIYNSAYLEAGFGYGLGVSGKVADFIDFNAVLKCDIIHMRYDKEGYTWSHRLVGSFGICLFDEIDLTIFEEIQCAPLTTNSLELVTEPSNDFALVDLSVNLILGASISIGFNMDSIDSKLNEIWG